MLSNFTVKNLIYDYADPRIRDKFLMSSPVGIFSIFSLNFILHFYFIPLYMRNRKPFSFWFFFHLSDIVIIIKSAYFVCIGVYYYFWRFRHINLRCLDFIDNETDAEFDAEVRWQFFMSMFVYVLHNFAFSLSKRKCATANYLLIHHTIFPIIVWTVMRYYPGQHVSMEFWC